MTGKLKSLLLDDAIFYALLVILVAIVAFLLGRNSLTQLEPQNAGVVITQQETPRTSPSTQSAESADTAVVASRSGTKYHLPSCPGAKQIKNSNRISFSSIESAKAAGYSAAANCKGI